MTRKKKYSAQHEATPSGIAWVVRDPEGEVVARCASKGEAEDIAARRNALSPPRKSSRRKGPPPKQNKKASARPLPGASMTYDAEFYSRLGRRIRARRKDLGLTMREVGLLEGVKSRSYLERVENGKANPSLGYMLTLCGRLRWTLGELLNGMHGNDEFARLRAIETACIKHLDDCALERVTGRPWQELRR